MFMKTENFLRDKCNEASRYFMQDEVRFIEKILEEYAQFKDSLQKAIWISVEDKLPEHHKKVLIAVVLDQRLRPVIRISSYEGGAYWRYDGGEASINKITHWMPLPELPKSQQIKQ